MKIGSLCSGYEGASGSWAMLLNPALNILGLPDLATAEDGDGFREVASRRELLNALAADAKTGTDLGCAHQVVHDGNHSHHATCRLTRWQAPWDTSHMPSPLRHGVCVICRIPFQTRRAKTRTCGRKCGAILREREHPSPGTLRDYPPEIVQLVRDLYESGLTVAEVQRRLPKGFQAQNIIRRYQIPTRPLGKRDQVGPANSSWRGNAAGFAALHLRVKAARGKPSRCACCDTTDPSVRYHWANLTGHYEDVYDYARLCASCHLRLDARRRAVLGRSTQGLFKEVMGNV